MNPISSTLPDAMATDGPPAFIFVICQQGAESPAKSEILGNHPELKLSYSRPGFLTFKVDPVGALGPKFHLKSTLARTYGWSLGKLEGDHAEGLVEQTAAEAIRTAADRVHVWQREALLPGKSGFEPGISALAQEVASRLEVALAEHASIKVNQPAQADQRVLDVVLVEPGQWWIGFHFAATVPQRWPGGVPMIDTSVEVFSRAYFKLKEALQWSGIRVSPGDQCAEIGSAPGGACQLLLELGAKVIGIDPAEMEEELLKHENFTHIRRRGNEVKKRDFRDVRWLFADLNMAPTYTLDTLESIVKHDAVHVKGVVMTLKLSDWELVSQIPSLIDRIKSWGFQVVKARQLAFNRREFCVAAIKNRFTQRDSIRRKADRETAPVSETPAEDQPTVTDPDAPAIDTTVTQTPET